FSAALELMHCASLVHDDLPCFDDAATRRGRPSVHAAFGERLAVLAGDSLIVLAFRCVIRSRVREALRLQQALSMLEFAVAPPFGIAAGQAWECEPRARLSEYQRSKTGALFAAATEGGAICGGGDGPAWRLLGESLGEAYQVADDIRDVVLDQRQLGKPANQDILLDRPSAARQFGLEGAYAYFDALMTRALSAIPPCAGEARLRNMVLAESERLLPLSVRSAGLQPAAGPLSIGLN
ncbi:MAG: geranylgeranyl pyrophosphate synthase, partial [Betaproteobacteria bacterium]|nr:geranylgeranyl pyrophosphate synthase [Betaproteobacteria bacterium]